MSNVSRNSFHIQYLGLVGFPQGIQSQKRDEVTYKGLVMLMHDAWLVLTEKPLRKKGNPLQP